MSAKPPSSRALYCEVNGALWGAGGDRAPRTPLPAVGDEVTGKVNRTAAYGVFVDLENNIRGLLHVDEVAIPEGDSSREPNLRAMFSEGEAIKVRLAQPRKCQPDCAVSRVVLLLWQGVRSNVANAAQA